MSFFYLTPVKGNLEIHVLEVIVKQRIEYLNAIINNNTIQYNEYVYDNVGHFMLCLVAVLEQNNDFNNFILKTEKALFQSRLKTLSSYDLRRLAKRLLKFTRKIEVYSGILEPLQILSQQLSLKYFAHHVSSECYEQCFSHFIKLKFVHCLNFISKRQIETKHGIAYVPCNKWIDLLIHLFKDNLKNKLYYTKLYNLRNDPRINELVRNIRRTLPLWKARSPNILTSHNVDGSSHLFPPCMLNLHAQLRKRHRLSHRERFNYSLFLKDIGMPVNESVEFWRSEYSTPPYGHSCCHNWSRDEKKFLYSIRHMYGLEGSRKHYTCNNCHQIQGIENCLEGGCPFKSFGTTQLQSLLQLTDCNPFMSKINEFIERKQYTKACLFHLQNNHNGELNCNKVDLNFTPVKYYGIKSMK